MLVLEGSATVGGGTRSAALTLPGFVHDVCATVHALGAASPALQQMGLERHGLEWAHPEIALAHPLDDGTAGVLDHSLDRTADGLGRDGRSWRRLFQPLLRDWDSLIPQLLGPIVSVPRHPLVLARFGVNALVPASIMQRRFDTRQAAALFGGCAAHAFLPLTHPLTSAFGISLALAGHAVG